MSLRRKMSPMQVIQIQMNMNQKKKMTMRPDDVPEAGRAPPTWLQAAKRNGTTAMIARGRARRLRAARTEARLIRTLH